MTYEADWLSPDEATNSFDTLYRELNWVERSIIAKGKVVQQPRLMTWAGELPIYIAAKYSSHRVCILC